MDIIEDNLFRIVYAGAFHEQMSIRPMSIYKWNTLKQLATSNDLDYWIVKADEYYPSMIPDCITNSISYEHDLHNKDIVRQELTNRWLNNSLQSLIEKENNSDDASPETLCFLNIVIANINYIMKYGVSINLMLLLGVHLRNNRTSIDFDKIDHWLDKVHLHNMAELLGSFLIIVFNFSKEELPFVKKLYYSSTKKLLKSFLHPTKTPQEWHFSQEGNGIFIKVSTSEKNNILRSLNYLRFSPVESSSVFLNSISKGLSEFEE